MITTGKGKTAKGFFPFFLLVSNCSPHAAECCCGQNCVIFWEETKRKLWRATQSSDLMMMYGECVRQMMRSLKRHATISIKLRGLKRENVERFSHESRKLHLIRSSQAPLDVIPTWILASSSIIIDVHRVYFSFLLLLLPKSNQFSGHLKTFFVASAALLIIARNSSSCSRSEIMMMPQHVSIEWRCNLFPCLKWWIVVTYFDQFTACCDLLRRRCWRCWRFHRFCAC